MTVRVRFAPSPTGKLHVGNVRTALMNWLFAKKEGGTFILRIDDTDLERSTNAYEDGIREDLTWLGFEWQETFNQSHRFPEYEAAAKKLKAEGFLYPCYETSEELDRQRKLQRVQGKPPVYNRGALELTDADIAKLEAEGRKPHWRFKLSGNPVTWTDIVRGEQTIDTSSISDPVLIRADGSFLYTLPSVVDDIEAKITHVIRGEDHVTNSGAQIEIFKSLSDHLPSFAHTPLLVGKDGKGLSKRLGSLSMGELREQYIEPLAICSLLGKIGTSDPIEARPSLDVLVEEFSFEKIGRAPARFDEDELLLINGRLLHETPFEDVEERLEALGVAGGSALWFAIRGNVEKLSDAVLWSTTLFAPMPGRIEEEDKEFCAQAAGLLPETVDQGSWGPWLSAVKAETGRKGKGLFMPLRRALTGQDHGPEMEPLLALMGAEKARLRLEGKIG
ncbi:glutamyl-tRNA synthetase [Litorimonas taeanensis]|uniref:Glutamate--tRNA ligase n=1 Tax=Litorimonas taeanensis TaxID=568099 RepID=A0A420WKH3_9PROT|nr:glutamate--tRNA ligase [Litorimonas taeanensis]RKQ71508.1 glutamyl-tRNA synthetase [Litorimonas taeanensis]